MHMQAQRKGGGIIPTHLQPDTMRWVVGTTLRPLCSRDRLSVRRLSGHKYTYIEHVA